jgi:hypothetical protein
VACGAINHLFAEPDAHLHVSGFAEGDMAFVLTHDGLEVWRRAEVYGSENWPLPLSSSGGDQGPWATGRGRRTVKV